MLLLSRFRELERRELSLRRRFLKWRPAKNAFGTPAPDEIRAYCVLFHAEVESYLEEVARDCIELSKSLLEKKNVANGVIFTLVASMHDIFSDGTISEEDRLSEKHKGRPVTKKEWIALCSKQAHTVISSNNGIKEENILKMFRPLGVDLTKLDPLWLPEMTQMGNARGGIAHDTLKLTQVPSPNDLKVRVDLMMKGCGELRLAAEAACRTTLPASVALADAAAGP